MKVVTRLREHANRYVGSLISEKFEEVLDFMNVRAYKLRDASTKELDNLVTMRLSLQRHIEEKNSYLWKISDRGITEIREFYNECLNSIDSKLIVAYAKESGQIIGMGLGRVILEERYIPKKSGRIDDIWVEPQYRRKGICTEIVKEIMEYFKSQGIKSIILDYVVGDETAEKTWASFGFNPILIAATIDNQ